MTRHKLILTLSLLAMLVACKHEPNETNSIQYVKTAKATDTSQVGMVSYPGKTRSKDDANLSFRVSGPISRVLVKEGDHVSKGQTIALMDQRDYQVQLSATQAEYEQVKADAERIMAMYAEGNTTASNYDKARYGLEQMTQKLSNHRNQLADTRLYAPMDGYIQNILHEAGETVSAGMPVVSMFGSKGVEVEVNISAFDYANRDRIKNVYCKFDLMPDEEFPLQVASISPEANASQLYTVRLRFAGQYDTNRITPGMSAMVYVNITDDSSSNVMIPATAIFDHAGNQNVYVYDKKSSTVKSRSVKVKRLHRNGNAEVSEGLAAGDEVVTAGVHHITDGQKVTPLPASSTSNIGGLL
ncbi:MAG: efflux RND transporter periplasmic adaptor subunit [Bacteroidaceae bacterium]|nr:efflux RND transporter periplasmic adaptor subunit [Bacteroidaceae bacterium]